MNVTALIDTLAKENVLSREGYLAIIKESTKDDCEYLFCKARSVREKYYQKDVYVRGLIEFTNYCKNNCLYCGIRCQNTNAERYRLSKEDILECAKEGYQLGFRTFVLQGGEDNFYTTELLGDIIKMLREHYPDCAITLSVGERERKDYEYWFSCGANRYLLRHETATKTHYEKLHPAEMSFDNRMHCLNDLKEIGYQVGAGFMVGSPYQTEEHLADELLFLKDFNPHMVGIGPFIAQKDSPFAKEASGTLDQTLLMLGLIRLTLPTVLLPSTTALGTIDPKGRELGILAGANVVMPNLSPVSVRKKYELYDNKICTGEESAQCRHCLSNRMESIGYHIVTARGDYVSFAKK